MKTSFWRLLCESIQSASILEQGVLIFLVALSIISWAVIIMKMRALRQMKRNPPSTMPAVATVRGHTGIFTRILETNSSETSATTAAEAYTGFGLAANP